MGDRCYIAFTVKASDKDKFLELSKKYDMGYFEEENDYGNIFEFVCIEANYGYYSEIDMMVQDPECPPFSAWQGAGGDYGVYEHIFMDGVHRNSACSHEGGPVLHVSSDTPTDYDDIAYLFLHFELNAAFRKYCEETQ